jgi:hypothetical protein
MLYCFQSVSTTYGKQMEDIEMSEGHVEVSMGLLPKDDKRAENIRKLIRAPNKAKAVSVSLALTDHILSHLQEHPDAELALVRPDGDALIKVTLDMPALSLAKVPIS